MKKLRYLFAALILLCSAAALNSCQSEQEMENYLLKGYCWEGVLPIYSDYHYTEHYSRFFFEPNGTGGEEHYINGRFDNVYYFDWWWKDEDFGVLLLNYGTRWQIDQTCIDVLQIDDRQLRGYFYKDRHEYEIDKASGFQYSREARRFSLRTLKADRHPYPSN